MAKQLAWKVVRPNYITREGLWSFVQTSSQRVEYLQGQWTEPPTCGKPFLFVCATRKDARQMAWTNAEAQVWRCEVSNMTNWRAGENNGHSFKGDNGYWPKGTRFADKVKLLYRA